MSATNADHQSELVDITDLLRDCASQCLSYSYPFTPTGEDAAAEAISSSESADISCDLVDLLKVTSLDGKLDESVNGKASTTVNYSSLKSIAPINLRDAMSALEIGDKRMDCCEIPLHPLTKNGADDYDNSEQPSHTGDGIQNYSTTHDIVTYPPRIAPKNLSDGTPLEQLNGSDASPNNTDTKKHSNHTLFLPRSPCHSLLPYWESLSLSPNSPTCLLPLLLLQYTALEAYVGTESGGSNAAETLYCMLWCHEGILADMADRLGVWDALDKRENVEGEAADELSVAQWALFASSIGVVKIAEVIRSVVLDADIYEEENFGVESAGGTLKLIRPKNDVNELSEDMKGDNSANLFGLKEEHRKMKNVWDIAISKLEEYKSGCNDESRSTTQALILLLQAQQSFFLAVQILYNLNDRNVMEFTEAAKAYSRETVRVLTLLHISSSVDHKNHGLVESDGRLCEVKWLSTEVNNHACCIFLSASFDPFVNRRSLGNAPIRKARFNKLSYVINSMSNLASELDWAVCDVLLNGDTLGRITRMLTNNSVRGCGGAVVVPNQANPSKVGIDILSRSLMLLNLYFDDKLLGQYDFSDIIGQHMMQLSAVPEAMIETSGSWLDRLAKPLYDTLKALCLDRHRERTFTETIIFPAFGTLQNEAASVDDLFRSAHGLDPNKTPAYATNYVIVQTLRLMERHVGLGIELGLYPHWYDLSQAFWYRDFLLTALVNVQGSIEKERLERKVLEFKMKLEHEEEERIAQLEQQSTQKKSAGGKKKKGKKQKGPVSAPESNSHAAIMEAISKVSPESFEDRIHYTTATLHRSLCRGMVRLIAAAHQAKVLKDPPPSVTLFTTHKMRFEKRFEVFCVLPQPPSLSYDDYATGSDFSAVNSRDLIAAASDCFRNAKSVVDRLLEVILPKDTTTALRSTENRINDDLFISIRREEIMALAKVCVSNSLFLLKLETSSNGQNPKQEALLTFNAHKEYCTVSA